MQTTILHISGMHCNSCKILVEKSLIQLPDIQQVDANVRKWQVKIWHNKKLNLDEIKSVIRECWYEVVDTPVYKPRFSKSVKDYQITIISLISFLILFLIFRETWLFTWEITADSSPSLWMVILIWLTAGFSSCMAVVWGLVMAISAKNNKKDENLTFKQKIVPHFWFNLWRIVGFVLLGWVLGLIGHMISISPFLMSVMMFLAWIVMLILGINLSWLSPKISNFSIPLPVIFSRQAVPPARGDARRAGGLFQIITWLLTFFLPCWFTFAMQLYALSTGNFWMGAIIMGLFALWTLPWLIGVGSLTSIFRWAKSKVAYQAIWILVILLAIYNISNAWPLIKSTLFSSTKLCDEISWICEISGDKNTEIINMTYDNNGLSPAKIEMKLWKRYKILIDVQKTVYGCMSTVLIPGLNPNIQYLEKWKTISFDISADKTGEYKFVCAMGLPHWPVIVIN